MTNMRSGELGLRIIEDMEDLTRRRIADKGLGNARKNREFFGNGRSLADLRGLELGNGRQALVIAAGPSLRRQDPAALLKARGFAGALICTDSSILYCLRNGLVPDLVVTLDPHAKRIVRWFGDPGLSEHDLSADDYFQRQDLDSSFQDELRVNEEILDLLEEHGPRMRIALSTSSAPAVVRRAVETGMEIFWWNPMYDDPDVPGSISRSLYRDNGYPCVNAGGNVGSACWMMADAVLGVPHVGLTGVDFSYYGDTPYRNTQYYDEAVALVGEDRLDEIYIRIFNPYLNEWFYTDPAYMWYRNSFLEMASDADCITYNCTEGGILFGDHVEFVSLEGFIGGEAIVEATGRTVR